MRRQAKLSEAALQQHIVKLLQAYARPDIEWHHPANGEKRDKATARKLQLMGLQAGVADLLFVIDGRAFAVELKTEKGVQSEAQSEYQERFERAGGKYFLAFGLDQAIGTLQGINAFRAGISFTIPKSTANAFLGRTARSEAQRKVEPRINSI